MRCDILYCEGPGDIVAAHESWRRREQFRSETSVTFSSQVFEFCAGQQLSLYAVSHCPRADRTAEAAITVENKPRWLCRLPLIGYHLSLFIYALRLLVLALRLRPQVILVTSGVVEWGFACLLRLSGAKVVPILHNALWPVGYRPGGLRQWVQERVHRFFWRVCVWQTLAVSAALADQVRTTAGAATTPLTLFQPTFSREAFAELPPAAGFEARPFRVLYVGRIEENKGALDLVPIAAELLARCPGGFEFDVCGDGSARAELDARVRSAGLQAHFRLYGRLDRVALTQRYLAAHAVVVPTRTNFTEGFAMVVAEAILCLKPVISSAVVPATQVLSPAVLLATPDDVPSYVEAIERLSRDASLYRRLVDEARRLRAGILDDRHSFLASLRALGIPSARVAVEAATAAADAARAEGMAALADEDDDEVVSTAD